VGYSLLLSIEASCVNEDKWFVNDYLSVVDFFKLLCYYLAVNQEALSFDFAPHL